MRTYTDDELQAIHRLSIRNHDLLSKSGECACFSCLARYQIDEIDLWIDEEPGKTAFCPHCGIDSIVPGDAVDDDLLKAMQKHYF